MAADVDSLMKKIRDLPDATHGVGTTIEELRQAEITLGVNFPWSFRRYLEILGWLSLGSREFFGLGCDVPEYLQLVKVTLSERSEVYPPLPESLLPFYNDGSGNHYCIDISVRRGMESPVVFWDHDLPPEQQPDEIADSFAVWLGSIIL